MGSTHHHYGEEQQPRQPCSCYCRKCTSPPPYWKASTPSVVPHKYCWCLGKDTPKNARACKPEGLTTVSEVGRPDQKGEDLPGPVPVLPHTAFLGTTPCPLQWPSQPGQATGHHDFLLLSLCPGMLGWELRIRQSPELWTPGEPISPARREVRPTQPQPACLPGGSSGFARPLGVDSTLITCKYVLDKDGGGKVRSEVANRRGYQPR